MKTGQRVRLRSASPIARRDHTAAAAIGTVLCSYKVRARSGFPERVDVRFSADTVMWGVAANEFETVEDNQQVA